MLGNETSQDIQRWLPFPQCRHSCVPQSPAEARADLPFLNTELLSLVDSLRPSIEEQQQRQTAFSMVQSVLQQHWPQAKVHLFGSTASKLSICNNNDIDVCLELPGIGDEQVRHCSEILLSLHLIMRAWAQLLSTKASLPACIQMFGVPACCRCFNLSAKCLSLCIIC